MNQNDPNKPERKSSKHRDPITGAPGSHPIGTGVGAAAGGAAGIGAAAAAGAAAGTAAGPVGTGVGAAAGAIIGGLGGKAMAENMSPTGGDSERYLDYTVVDRNNDKVGSVDAVWQDHTGQPAYLGIRTGWLGMGKAHVVPTHAVDVSDSTRKIRLPYTSDMVKDAPSFEEQADIDRDAERRIADYYRQHGFENRAGWDADTTEAGERDTRFEEGERRVTDEEVRIPLSHEEVNIGKREVEAGGVRLRKVIRTETVNRPVELKREEIVVERVPTSDRTPSRTDVAFREEEVYIPLRREEPVVEKTATTSEEVRVGKRSETERREISETVRREDVDIQQQGDAKKPKRNPRT